MSKNEYIQELRGRIAHLPLEEQDAALTYYFEYLEELGEENIDQAIRELGTPREVAERIIADYTQRMASGEARGSNPQEGSGCLVASLLVFASPLIFALAVVALALVIVVIVITLIPLLLGIILFFVGMWALFAHVGTGLVILGGSLISTGLFCLMIVPIIMFWKFILNFFRRKKDEKRRQKGQAGYNRASYYNKNYSSNNYSGTNNSTRYSNYSQTPQPNHQPNFTENHNNPMEPPQNFQK